MRNDRELEQHVRDELRWDPSVGDKELGIAVKDGVVTITGAVKTYAEKLAAQQASQRVGGVRAVADDVKVELLGFHERTDTDIAHAAVRSLNWNSEVPKDHVKVEVQNGWITLEGAVEWDFQRAAADHAVRYLTGVIGVTNCITITPRVSPTTVKTQIEQAFQRHAELDGEQISVKASGSTVTLRGLVRSWTEREDAQHAAWNAPGVQEVKDELTVAT